ncbi:hypothetical protein E1263_33055 [Kribbella antibiotica]|uniref:Uncharacterized protein n=1 Tax=Kribbella antibiotica TaxID=190195 RepID=A0A4R4YTY0_9ACTN|nr:hypothetical protein [Kribbella antibiotica]TDD48736.1 hypothetical protein E1263_33055 [Kribbella antibiotica]
MAEDLALSELVPIGGTWKGLLFANPKAGVSTTLTWEFSFDFEPLEREFSSATPGLTVDWAVLPEAAWTAMAGLELACDVFAEPVEGSFYYFEHHRYDSVRLTVLEQQETRLRVRATLGGDIDDLGLSVITVEAWLDFEGVYVHLPEKPASVELAAEELAGFTSVDGLVGEDRDFNYLFAPAAG